MHCDFVSNPWPDQIHALTQDTHTHTHTHTHTLTHTHTHTHTHSLDTLSPFGETAGPRFQKLVAESWELVTRIPLPSWPFVRDQLAIFRRRSRTCKQGGEGGKGEVVPPCSDMELCCERQREGGGARVVGAKGEVKTGGSGLEFEGSLLREKVLSVHRRLFEMEMMQQMDAEDQPAAKRRKYQRSSEPDLEGLMQDIKKMAGTLDGGGPG